jgi:glutathione S-transferase
MKLYFAPGACSLSPHIVVHEAGLADRVALAKVDIRKHLVAGGGDYYAINPKGYVPALALDDGTVLTEGPVIVQYLADQAPGSGLAPACGTLARYQLQEMLNFLSTEIHKAWSPLWNKAAAPEIHADSRQRIDRRFGNLKAVLEAQPYLMGEAFSVADAYLFTLSNWGQWTGVDIGQWPWIKAHHARVAARPAVLAALAAERALK